MQTVLIVDIDEDVLIRLQHTLEAEGYSTDTAWSGREALCLAKKSKFDMLLVGDYLGDLDSGTLVDKLKELQPSAALLLMRARKKPNASSQHLGISLVCKFEQDEVMKKVRDSLAA